MKNKAKELFLFRHRYVIGYILIGVIFLALLFILPFIAPEGLSNAEMNAAVTSENINENFIKDGNVIDLPYHGVQKICMKFLGLSLYSLKIPSIIFGAFAAFFLVLLLNRWFKSDVAIIGSALTTLSTAFLCLANFGTPSIMPVFWLSFILWLGSKIVGNNSIKPFFVILFTSAVAFSLYTPNLFYVALIILIAGITHPHLRCSLKRLKIYQMIIMISIFAVAVTPLLVSVFFHPEIIRTLIFMEDFSIAHFLQNIRDAFAPFFSFAMAYDSIYLAPLFGLGTIALIVIGALASLDRIFASRNVITIILAIFAVIISGFNKEAAVIIIVPIAIMTASAIESLITRWHSLFPHNPYAHLAGAVPLIGAISLMLVSGLSHYIQGYHYTPRVTKNFNNDIEIISEQLHEGDILVVNSDNENFAFYRLFEPYHKITVVHEAPIIGEQRVAVLDKSIVKTDYELNHIAVSSKSRNSDRLYIYTKVTEEKTGEE